LVLLSAGYLLWSNGHRRFAVLAWIVWPAMLGLSLMNTIGFSATHISDAFARRSAVVTAATNKATAASYTASDLQDWRTERKGITEKRTVDELKIQLALDRRKPNSQLFLKTPPDKPCGPTEKNPYNNNRASAERLGLAAHPASD